MDIFSEIALVVVLAAVFGLIAHYFKQPTIVGYLFAGITLSLLISEDLKIILSAFSDIGIALLLFMVGLEMNISGLKEIGRPAIYTGIGQIVFTFTIGLFILKFLGFALIPSIYISIALTLSSTIIVIQLLSQKRDLQSLYGKIVVGFLLMQDFIAILALMFLAGLKNLGPDASLVVVLGTFTLSLAKGFFLIVLTLIFSKYIFPKALDYLGKSQELLFLFGNAWGLGLAALMAAPFIGFSKEMGGFLAGLALANSIENFQISSRIRPIRDFFIMAFFVLLGSELVLGDISSILAPTILLSLFVLVGNPIIVFVIMAVLGYRSRTSFLASLTVAQISEFSLIIAAMGSKSNLGHLSDSDVSLITLVGVITITASSYLIMHGDKIYDIFKPYLKAFEFRRAVIDDMDGAGASYANHVVLAGVHRMGSNIVSALRAIEESFVAIDFDPEVVEKLKAKHIPVVYGDIADDDIKERSALGRARVLISTIPDLHDNMLLIDYMKRENPKAIKILTAENEWEAKDLYAAGADYVILPHFIGGLQIAQAIKKDHNFDHIAKLKNHDLALIRGNA